MTVLDLKRVAEKQLKEIVMLQKEIEIVKYNSGSYPHNKHQKDISLLDNQIWSHTEDHTSHFRSPANDKLLKSLQIENEDLLQERKQLLSLCEDLESQVKDSHKSLEESLEKIIQLEKEVEKIEEIRNRITEVAELFEKKEIKQRYSFEVLCDFVYDKAKRLFNKYEQAIQKGGS